jgi:hypothetical protein
VQGDGLDLVAARSQQGDEPLGAGQVHGANVNDRATPIEQLRQHGHPLQVAFDDHGLVGIRAF